MGTGVGFLAMRFWVLWVLWACKSESPPVLVHLDRSPSPTSDVALMEEDPSWPDFEKSSVYAWPGVETVVWYVDGGMLDSQPTLILSEARFGTKEDGRPTLLPATIEILTQGAEGWQAEVLTDPKGAVIYKAVLHDGGILTISGGFPGSNQPGMLRHWRRADSGWQVRTIWSGAWTGSLNRLRDFEIGDVDGDGQDEVVIGTHDQGAIVVLDGGLDGPVTQVTELAIEANRYVHEIELGDINDDGVLEIFASRSEPNISDRSQAGSVEMFRFHGGGYLQEQIWSHEQTHVKEILAADLNSDGRVEILVAVEAQRNGKELLSPVEILQLFPGSGGTQERRLAQIKDSGLRFILAQEMTGIGPQELVLSSKNAGIYLLSWDPVAPSHLHRFESESGGFEHAIQIVDLDEDGRTELYVANDREKVLNRYRW